MDTLRAMQIFTTVVEAGSLTGASERLGLSGPAVVRSLAALESTLGVRLLNRTTRRSSLTDEGREYFEGCKRVLAEADAAHAALSARRTEPRGRLRLTAPITFGRLRVAPVVADFAARHLGIEVDLLLLDRVVDLVEEGIDAAVRIGPLPDSSLVALGLGETRRVTCASPAYLRRAGTPRSPQDLRTHRLILFSGLAAHDEWVFATPNERPGRATLERVPIRPFLRTNQLDAAMDPCLRGLGCAQFLCYQVEPLLRAGKLRRLLAAHEPAPLPIHIVSPSSRGRSSNVNAFIDFARDRLRYP